MSDETLDYCRLCCSTKNLISMFKGKSRVIRNSLRKMIQEVIQIQIEMSDYSSSVCFNCLVDISNFYHFKLHCIQNNEKLKDIEDGFPNAKKFKQSSMPLESIEKPDLNLTQDILEWLQKKRGDILEPLDISQTFADKDCQTSLECIDSSTQCELESRKSIDLLQTFSDKDCQTSFEGIDSATQCELESQKALNISRTFSDKDCQTFLECIDSASQCELESEKSINISRTFSDKDCQTSYKYNDASTQFDNVVAERYFKKRSKSSQTNAIKLKNSHSQTTLDSLSQRGFVNNVVFKVPTKVKSVQTNQEQQRAHTPGINGFKCALPLDSLVKNVSIPFNLKDSSCQTEAPQIDSLGIQCDLLNIKNLITSPELYKSPPNPFLRDSKIDIKVCCKEEKLSPLESLSVVIPPEKSDSQVTNFSDLLKVNKSDCVHICKICDQSLYNRKEVSMHNRSHMKCHFCKGSFKSIRFAQNHMKLCKFRRTSFVCLTRIDDEIVEK